jgi:integrase
MVTGMRRGELLALRWQHIDLDAATIDIRRAYFARHGHRIEKDTKSHQMRRAALDDATVALLRQYRASTAEQLLALGFKLDGNRYVFSGSPDHSRPYDPSSVTRRYARMAKKLQINTTALHALRHYNAAELLRNGVDLRTVAGRLGHGGGGATTLRVYAAWVTESDRRAASVIAGRLPPIRAR